MNLKKPLDSLWANCKYIRTDIKSGTRHVTVLTCDGRIYQWGSIDIKLDDWQNLKPGFVSENLENLKVVQIACGNSHTLALTEDHQVFSWGNNMAGQLGTGNRIYEPNPKKITGVHDFNGEIIAVACSAVNSIALDSNGHVL